MVPWLNVVWFALLAVIVAGYLIMDGFDLGVGIVHPFLAKGDTERRVALNSIGPVWDGNEVWLVLAGGALFAAFPMAYASLFSGFYTAMMLVLLVLILRAVAIEFRSKRPSQGWRRFWDGVFWAASLGIALLLGVAFGNVMQGLALDQSGNIRASLLELLNPFALLVGVTTVAMLATHGTIYLCMKTDGAQRDRVRRAVPPLLATFFVLNTLVIAATVLGGSPLLDRYQAQPLLFALPLVALASAIAAWSMVRRQRHFVAFLLSAAMIATLLFSVALGLYPNLLVSNLDPAYSLTVVNAASEANTLTVMLVVASHRPALRAAVHGGGVLPVPRPGAAGLGQLLSPASPPARRSLDRRLLAGDGHARRALALAVGAGALAGAVPIAQAWLLAGVVDAVFLGGAPPGAVAGGLAALLGLVVLRSGALWLADDRAADCAGRVKARLRRDLGARRLAAGPVAAQASPSGEQVSTAVDAVEALEAYVTEFLPARALAVLLPLGVLAAVFVIDPWTTLVLAFAGPMLILILALIGGRARELSARRLAELGWLSAFYLDLLQGLPTLKLFGRSREQAATIEAVSRRYGETTMAVLATAFQTSLVMEWAATAATAMVALEVSLRLMHGALGFQPALALLLLTPEFFLPLRQLALRYHAGTAGRAATARIFDQLDQLDRLDEIDELDQPDRPAPGVVTSPERLDLELRAVSVRYAPRAAPGAPDPADAPEAAGSRPLALADVSFTIPAGRTVALVGPSGAGKSTVASLLLRFVEPAAGEVRVGGRPLGALDAAAWRRQVAWVPQRPHLFHGTVADNLRLARPEATPAELAAAARAAHAHDFISALPRGYDTPLGEGGARLSGGQRQRLAIARAFLKDAPILVLDEATAHLDAESEALVRDGLARLGQGRTVLLIAHRLRLAYQADRIVVLDRGRVVETGDHAALLAGGTLYPRLVALHEGEA
jgi:thiol reductant ABC exporter CydD subunit/cytochrome d oxidase subunit CydB